MRVLSLKDPAVVRVRHTHPGLVKKSVIGRGSFCAVFESSSSDRVLKLTTDRAHADYLTDGCAPDGDLKPQVFEDFGEVGATTTGIPLRLFEVERLVPLVRGTPLSKLVLRIIRYTQRKRRFPDDVRDVLALSEKLAKFMWQLNCFTANFDYACDAKFNNFMQRADGSLVFNDPIFDRELFIREQRRWANA